MEKVSINQSIRLSEHITLGEVTKSRHAEVYNIPSHVAIENLKRVCAWSEEQRRRYNLRYVLPMSSCVPSVASGKPSGGARIARFLRKAQRRAICFLLRSYLLL